MDTEELLEFFKTLSNAERLKIVGLLANEALTAVEIARRLELAPTQVIRHLERLQGLGLIRPAQVGSAPDEIGRTALMLDTAALEAMSRRILAGSRPRFQAGEAQGEDFDRKVLGDFMTGEGRLKAIPSQEKKLLAVLRYLAQAFQPGERYSEKEVNVMLARHHPDAAALRRYLVDNNFLKRDRGVYWKD